MVSVSVRAPAPSRLALPAVCLGYFMVILDATAVNLSLPALGRDVGGGVGALQWVIDGYTLTFAAFLLTAGSLGDRYGARRVFCGGLVLFVAASAACGLAPDVTVLVAARLAQGTSTAAASGPVVGGLLTEAVSWRRVFFVNVPVGVVALLLTRRHVPAAGGHGRPGLDPIAQVLIVGALAALTFALIDARTAGWADPVILGGLAAAVALITAFAAVERRVASPMLPLGLFGDRGFAGGTAIGLLINLGFYGQLFVISIHLQDARHMSPVEAGLALLPEGVLVSVAAFLSGRRIGRAGVRPTLLLGLCTGAAGFFGLMAAGPGVPYAVLVPPLMAVGFGMAYTMPAATTTVVEAAPADRAGVASGAINTGRQVGSTIGVALAGTLAVSVGLPAAMAASGAAFLAGAAVSAGVVPRYRT